MAVCNRVRHSNLSTIRTLDEVRHKAKHTKASLQRALSPSNAELIYLQIILLLEVPPSPLSVTNQSNITYCTLEEATASDDLKRR